MARLGRFGFLAVAVVFHLIYIYSIVDIYFVSPIVTGMRAFSVENEEAPAKRLFLFVGTSRSSQTLETIKPRILPSTTADESCLGDGLRADKAFQSFPDPSPSAINSSDSSDLRPLTPFLRSRVLSHGTFGVSHTRVPPESRPGHVALIAGLYEDVSAVTTGWKLNPVNFDSIFNRSRHTWSWGSPDILPMFKEGAMPGRVDAETYGAEAEDYTQDATLLDIWVFNKVKELFEEAQRNQSLNDALREDKNVFFLHLLGLDTTGHAYRPYSREYLHNVQVVDQGVKEITQLVESFYGDNDTAFVFTADHGMSDWGSHGDGHPDNTRTPLIAWGSGIAKPNVSSVGKAAGHEDKFSWDWGLDHVQRNDVEQADIAALMAYLAGLDFPVNSVGELPLPYLAAQPKVKAKAMLVNAQEILEMYRVKAERKQSTKLRYKAFGPLGGRERSAQIRVEKIQTAILELQYDEAIARSIDLIKVGLAGLRYLQTYDWLFLRSLVTAGYLGWIVFAITTVIDLHILHGKTDVSRTATSLVLFSAVFIGICSILLIQQSSWTYYAYTVFPVLFWEEVFARRGALVAGMDVLLGQVHASGSYFGLIVNLLAFLGLLEALVSRSRLGLRLQVLNVADFLNVQVQSYFHREVYSICYIAAIAWPGFYGQDFIRENITLIVSWAVCCATMSIFTLLPVVKQESMNLM